MILQKYRRKISILWKSLKFIYGRYTIQAICRDICFVISTGVELYSITVLGRFIDETAQILLNWQTFNLIDYLGSKSFLYLVLIFILWVVIQICTQAKEYFYWYIYEKVWEDAQYMMMVKVSRSNLQDVEKEEFQDMVTYIPSFSIDRIATAYTDFSVIVSNIVKVIGSLIIVFDVMGWYTLLLLIFMLPEVLTINERRKKMKEQQDKSIGIFKLLNYIQNISLTIPNFSELRVNDIFSFLKRRYLKEYDEYFEGNKKEQIDYYQTKTIFSSIGQFLKYGFMILLLSFSIIKRITVGTFKALYDYVEIVYACTYNVIDTVFLLSNKLDYIDEFFKLMEYEGYGDITHGEIKLSRETPDIDIKDLTFFYPDKPEKKALNDFNFNVKAGEKVAIFGGDGSGKSTVVRILTGLYQIADGEYKLGGYPVKELDRGEVKKKMSVIFQNFINYNFTLKENVIISGKKNGADTKLYNEVSKVVELSKIIHKEKIDDSHILGKLFPNGQDLSPGDWQRLAIARMLYRNRRIFIMDEPFTYLDTISSKGLLEKIFDYIGKNRSLIYITRSIQNLDMFDRIYYMEHGMIVEEGNWEKLMRKKGKLYKEMCSKTS